MRSTVTVLLLAAFFYSCNNRQQHPDVSGIKVPLTTQRFERDLFDTTSNNLFSYLKKIQQDAPSFTASFLTTILNVDPTWPADTAARYVNGFIRAYRPVYDTAQIVFNNFAPYENEIKKALQYVKYYFPGYPIPSKIITYIGPVDGYGDALSADGLIVGLQHHLGSSYSLYQTAMVRQTYPDYVSQRFEPGYIVVNCVTNIIDDLFPETASDKPLVNQMIEKGKRLYLASQLLPGKEEYRLVGYTKQQLEDAYAHEEVIWDLFIRNSYLQVTDKNIIKNYLGESPKTAELGEGAPGNIAAFSGWQIVKKYMQKNTAVSLKQLMATDPEQIFQEAKYKP